MSKVMKSFISRGCLNLETSTGRTSSVDIDVGANLVLVDKFFLGDMLSLDCDSDADVETRILIGWNTFRQ